MFGGDPRALPGYSTPLAALGVFVLWFGWFGVNPELTLSVGDGSLIGRVAELGIEACAGFQVFTTQ